MRGDLLYYEGTILNNPNGEYLRSLIEDEVGLANSIRGYGERDYRSMSDRTPDDLVAFIYDYELEGIDFVSDPSMKGRLLTYEQKINNLNSEYSEQNIKEEKTMKTLQELRTEFPQQFAEFEKLTEDKLRKDIEKEFAEKDNTLWLAKMAEAREEGKKQALEEESVKKALTLSKMLESQFVSAPSDEKTKQAMEEKEKKVEAIEKELQETKQNFQKMLEEQAKIKVEKEKDIAIQESIKEYKHKDLLLEQLKDCKTADEVKQRAEKSRVLIESLMKTKPETETKSAGKGQITEQTEKGESTTESTDKYTPTQKMQRHLAGIED